MLLPSRRLCVIAPSLARLVLMRTNLVEAIVGEENGRFLIGDGRPFEISHCGGIISVGIFWVLNYVTRDLGERRPALFILLLLIINYSSSFLHFHYSFYIFIFPVLCRPLRAWRTGSSIDGSVHSIVVLLSTAVSRPRFCVLIQSEELLITEGLHEHQVVPHEVQVQGFLITLFPNHLRIKVGIGIIAAQEMAKRYMNFYVYVLARRPSPPSL